MHRLLSLFCIASLLLSAEARARKVCMAAHEKDAMSVWCADGELISSVVFASFGGAHTMPGQASAGTHCHRYKATNAACHYERTGAIVAHRCVGWGKCVLPAGWTSLFSGDPCPGFRKTLVVHVRCLPVKEALAFIKDEGPGAGKLLQLSPSQVQAMMAKPAETLEGFDIVPPTVAAFKARAAATGTVLLCHSEWMGIRQATLRIADALQQPVLMVGYAFGREDALGVEQRRKMKSLLLQLGIGAMLVQGVPFGVMELAVALRPTPVAVSLTYHSGLGVHNSNQDEHRLLSQMLSAALRGDVLLTFIEPDVTAYVRRLGVPACTLSLPFNNHASLRPKPVRALPADPGGEGGSAHQGGGGGGGGGGSGGGGRLRIGLWNTMGRDAIKNSFVQMGAACMVRGAELRVNEVPGRSVLAATAGGGARHHCNAKVVELGQLTAEDFERALGAVHLNLHATWTDAVPNVALDSLRQGVPVLVSDTTPIFESSPLLRSLLVEPRTDDADAIYSRILGLRAFLAAPARRAAYDAAVRAMFAQLDYNARASWGCFVASVRAVGHSGNQPSCWVPGGFAAGGREDREGNSGGACEQQPVLSKLHAADEAAAVASAARFWEAMKAAKVPVSQRKRRCCHRPLKKQG